MVQAGLFPEATKAKQRAAADKQEDYGASAAAAANRPAGGGAAADGALHPDSLKRKFLERAEVKKRCVFFAQCHS